MKRRVPDQEVDQRGPGEWWCKKIIKHIDTTGRMLQILVAGGS